MYNRKKVVVVMPAYNAAQTVTKTVDEVLQQNIVDEIILVDDRSRDDTVRVASSLLGVRVINDVLGTLVEAGKLGRRPDETDKADRAVEAEEAETDPGGG